MIVSGDSWVTVNTEEMGPVKCVSMRRDAAGTLSLGRRGIFPVISLVGAPMNKTLIWRDGKIAEHAEVRPDGKHTVRKFKKHSETILLKKPTLPDLVTMYNRKGDLDISHEVLSQVIFHAIGVKHVAVLDEYKSLFLGAAAVARGTSQLFRIDGHFHNIHILGALGFGMVVEEFTKESIPEGTDNMLIIIAQKKKHTLSQLLSIIQKNLTGRPMPIDFLLFHPVKEGILSVFNEMMQNICISLLDMREIFYREYQTRTGAIHPLMCKIGSSGFILSGTFFYNGR